MTVTDYILLCPAATEFLALPAEVQKIISSLGSEWPSYPMVGTQEYNGNKLLHVRMAQKLDKAKLEGMFVAHGLDWQVLSIRSACKDGIDVNGMALNTPVYAVEYVAPKAVFLPYLPQIRISATESRPVGLSDPAYLSTYAGTEPIQL